MDVTDRQRAALLEWYGPRRVAYPWRRRRDPYAVLVSEVMLQQTQASRVEPVFERFLAAFPDVEALAAAARSSVLSAWGGLGYNRRAVALSDAARGIVDDLGGRFPGDAEGLRALPGVGPYTAAAVASIAFGERVAAIDTNARRIVGRVRRGREDVPAVELASLANDWLDPERPGDWNQAVMDLGREVCRPRPRCGACPLADSCSLPREGEAFRPAPGRQPPFDGSFRQVRGDVVRLLRERGPASVATLARLSGHDRDRVARAVAALASDRIVEAGRATIAGSARGRVRLAR